MRRVLDPARVVTAQPVTPPRERRLLRDLLSLGAACAAVALVVWVVVFLRPWDPHMGSAAAARALRVTVGGGPYTCRRTENDGSIVGMRDVDYICTSVNAHESGYFVGTSRHRITETQPTG
jgi:branched-subunit amino acid ABC-type transport system permease component